MMASRRAQLMITKLALPILLIIISASARYRQAFALTLTRLAPR
jgi:hypothetical protein